MEKFDVFKEARVACGIEVGWAIRDEAILFPDSDREISTASNNMTYSNDNGQSVDAAPIGDFERPGAIFGRASIRIGCKARSYCGLRPH